MVLHLVLEFLDPVGCWTRPLSGYSCCQLVLTLHVTPKLCSANEAITSANATFTRH